LKSFQDMIDVIGAYGPNLPAHSYHEIRVPLLMNCNWVEMGLNFGLDKNKLSFLQILVLA